MRNFKNAIDKKREIIESSPSKRHIVHYKLAARNNELSYIHTTMINIGLVCGVALTRWKNAVNIMIEKDKGSPKLHRLRLVKLMEADLKFCLSTVFRKRMMDFATK